MALPFGPEFAPVYEAGFRADREALGLGGANFDHFFRDVERQILDYPWIYSTEVPESGGTLMRATRDAFPDIPPLYVYYKVVKIDRARYRVHFVGLSPAWSAAETMRRPWPST
jgi:hypothetical protein